MIDAIAEFLSKLSFPKLNLVFPKLGFKNPFRSRYTIYLREYGTYYIYRETFFNKYLVTTTKNKDVIINIIDNDKLRRNPLRITEVED